MTAMPRSRVELWEAAPPIDAVAESYGLSRATAVRALVLGAARAGTMDRLVMDGLDLLSTPSKARPSRRPSPEWSSERVDGSQAHVWSLRGWTVAFLGCPSLRAQDRAEGEGWHLSPPPGPVPGVPVRLDSPGREDALIEAEALIAAADGLS